MTGPDRERYQLKFFSSRLDDGRRLSTPKEAFTTDNFTIPGCFCKSRLGARGGIIQEKKGTPYLANLSYTVFN
ncbi:hypothetical protein DWY73_21555 [Bacteroides fragilis]|uniref:Uncharacterized protein n=2 Tax=Bacteroides TaxID=816 RepID=A0A015UZM8_BACFG|nr:hypothetical protein M125_4903 [Bacteroides fragilis str. 3998T(B)3]EXY93615.1 hypothetical protein M081_4316 [Bacteroides fragilis str. 3998 T(B) 4]EYB16794.1 hypothetical protein M066_4348 [Bacteroides fragilis str. I1345]KXT41617.1 hypothetical protein HMPREF2534_01264 [Bacteroides thetaiotaomicron]OCJ74542.1 hypothetical protein BCV58_21200 [Bacteroides fragilis]